MYHDKPRYSKDRADFSERPNHLCGLRGNTPTDNLMDIMMNYAAILSVMHMDNMVGDWFASQLTPVQDMMKVSW